MPISSTPENPLPSRFRLGEWEVDSALGELVRGRERVPLTGLSLALLLALAKRAGCLSDSESLISEVWKRDAVSDATLQQRVKLLRRALGDDSDTPRYIGTIRGRGYRLLLHPEPLPEVVVASVAASVITAEITPSPAPALPVLSPLSASLDSATAPASASVIDEMHPEHPASPDISAPASRPPALVKRFSLSKKQIWMFASLLVLILLTTLYFGKSFITTPKLDPKRLVVLPMSKAATEANDDLLADGLTEQLIWSLSRTPGLAVIARASAMAYKDQPHVLSVLARDLEVGSVLEGSMRREGKRLQIMFALIDVATRATRWSKRYDTASDGLANVQVQVAQEVAMVLGAHANQPVPALTDGDAYTLYLQGRQHYLHYTQEDNQTAMALFRASLARSPAYAPALAGLSDAHAQAVYQFGAPANQLDEALRYADAAIALAPELAEAHKARGLALDLLGRRREAGNSYRSASKLNPNYADALINEAILHWEAGQFADAYQLARRAATLDPLEPYAYLITAQILTSAKFPTQAEALLDQVQKHAPDNPMAHTIRCSHWFEVEDKARTERECQTLITRHPDYGPALTLTADIALAQGLRELALQRFNRVTRQGAGDDSFYARVRLTVMQAPTQGPALAVLVLQLQEKIARHNEEPEPQLHLAMVQTGLGENEAALLALESAVRLGFSDLHWLRTDPLLAPLRGNPRFGRVVAELEARVAGERRKLQILMGQAG